MTSPLVSLLLACAAASPLLAQAPAPDPNEPALTLELSATDVPKNGHVTILGLAYPEPGVQVAVTVTPPSGGSTVLAVTPNTEGRYSIVFGLTQQLGLYKVNAQAGAKTAAAKTQFTVQNYLIDIDDLVADNKDLLEQPDKLVTAIKTQVDGVPDSPAKTEMEAKLDALEAAVKPLADQAPHLAQALAPFKSMVTQNPDAEVTLQPLFDHLAQLKAETKKEKEEIAKEIAASEKGSKACDAIDHATQALKAVPDMIAIAKKPWEFTAAFATNMAKSELPPSAGPGAQAVGDLAKNLPGAAGSPKSSLAKNDGVGIRDGDRPEARRQHSSCGAPDARIQVRRAGDEVVRALHCQWHQESHRHARQGDHTRPRCRRLRE